ncbi:hypothetical protein [Pseudofrankia asymbiotica]|uniref:Uncharacterized protein n=1 Tax=Pseudofrankia asymbiotica TaxID=1834516 RepID=A0A1V2I1W5_9ACTN|nr:hypothetical protein [Pseudofrankia asymbiotica]ONH23834.1 hypothetical protein BL253_31960 [Pseudofrankia asymbiotica]
MNPNPAGRAAHPRAVFVVSCPACLVLDLAVEDEPGAIDAAGVHDDTHHGGAVVATYTPATRHTPTAPTAGPVPADTRKD